MIYGMKRRKVRIREAPQVSSDDLGFEALFLEHWASVYRLLRRLVGDPAEAEDLT
jgi:DNA-directed RNA polymerase specialized sigma24 family protein